MADGYFIPFQTKPGEGNNNSFVHYQNVPSAVWTVEHYLGKYPVVSVHKPDGQRMFGDEKNISTDVMTITFKQELTGYVTIN